MKEAKKFIKASMSVRYKYLHDVAVARNSATMSVRCMLLYSSLSMPVPLYRALSLIRRRLI